MRDQFITQNNLKELVRDAMNVYVASAYLQRSAIDDIKAVLNQLPNKGGRLFRFLLDKEFNPEPQLRQVLINMLLELPNTEVRIYRGARLFHAKLYIFESGNRLCTTIGSFNATAGGAGRNIEAGVQLSDRELARESKAFFDRYWNDPETEIANRDDSVVFVMRKFKPGDSVLVVSMRKCGVVLNDPPEFDAETNEWSYLVHVADSNCRLRESQLCHVRIAKYANEDSFEQTTSDLKGWFRTHFLEKEGDQADNTIASFASTRTVLYEYQFRPLFKILHAEVPRLLIADEVGLGKTIEAGIILKELMVRRDMTRVLVIVPNSLKTKWRDELQCRFDEFYEVLSGRDFAAFLEEADLPGVSPSCHVIITYDQLAVRQVQNALNRISVPPAFNLIIIDEAHWLKNSDTVRHKIARRLTKHAEALVMLTATPIQIGVVDLFNLIAILVPELCADLDTNGFSASLTVNERINRAIELLQQRDFLSFRAVIAELRNTRTFVRSIERLENYESIIERSDKCDERWKDAQISELACDLYSLNVLNQYVNRTLRKDVADKFPDRQVRTWEYSYSDAERRLYDAIVGALRNRYARNSRCSFAAITPERRAASCLMAMRESLDDWRATANDYLDGLDDDDDATAVMEDTAHVKDRTIKTSWEAAASALRGFPALVQDSKLEQLKVIIRQAFTTSVNTHDKKVMIFCIFKATIKYLGKQLLAAFPEAQIDTMDGDDPIEERENKRDRFRASDRPTILVCSEVAGEGLDFQFCHFLVNYDMPWNPSKLEQRAGRIDRMGQEAPVVTIVNLVNKHTIEDHIIAKLFERVKLFANTLGPLGEVLSGYQKEFADRSLSAERTPAAQEEYERRVLANVENKLREQQRFDANRVELFGAADYFYSKLSRRREYFLENELKLIWEDYLGQFVSCVTRKGDIYSLSMTPEISSLLISALLHRGRLPFNSRREAFYKTYILSRSTQGKPFEYTFSQACAMEQLNLQFLNIGHPLIQGAIHSVRKNYRFNREILLCKMRTCELSPGKHLLCVYRFSITDRTTSRIRHVEDHLLAIDVQRVVASWVERGLLLNMIIGDAEPFEDCGEVIISLKQSAAIRDTCVQEKAEEVLSEYERFDGLARNSKRLSLMRQHEVIVTRKQRDLSFRHNQGERDRLMAEIEQEKLKLDERLAELEQRDLRVSAKCAGMIFLWNEGVTG